MNDMSGVIIPKSDQINADDLIAGPRTIRITDVAINAGSEQPVSISFEGDRKVFRPCKSMSRVLVGAWGADAKAYIGRSLTLYRDPSVKWGGLEVGGIRISHLSHIERDMIMALTATKGSRKPYTVKPLAQQGGGTGFTIDEARGAIAAAQTMEALKTVWQRKQMEPYRAQLQTELDVRKAELSAPVDQADHGEVTTLASAMDEITALTAIDDINDRVAALKPLLGETDAQALQDFAAARIGELS